MRGECKRGVACPYRHTNITDQDLESLKKGYGSIENKIRERYHGINDPVATKILSKIKEKPTVPDEPEDPTITTLFIGGVSDEISQSELHQKLEVFGKIVTLKLLFKNQCGFVCYNSRQSAIQAMKSLYDNLFVGDNQLKILWAKN